MRIEVTTSISIVCTAAATSTGGNSTKMRAKQTPARNSTSGYCHEIVVLHERHLPRSAIKLAIGTKSVHKSVRLHERQIDRPLTPIPVLNRNATTLRKLPIIVPSINAKSPKMIVGMLMRANVVDFWITSIRTIEPTAPSKS